MRNARIVWLLAVLAIAMVGNGCKKKPPQAAEDMTGTTPGAEAPLPTERIPEPATPVTPPIGEPALTEADLARELRDVYFDFDRYDIRPDQRPTLEANGRWLMSNKGYPILIEGHCDERGTEEYNLALGDRRATATRDYLVTLGVSPDRLSTISYGEAYPVDPGHNESAWGKNRRARFTIKPGGAR
jgi:peptidoglycan-associated lipoprotein